MIDPVDKGPAAPSRRRFLIALSAATAIAAEAAEAQAPPPPETQPSVPPAGAASPPSELTAPTGPNGYRFLSSTEVETLTAMVDRLIPADEIGPGGVESGIVTFIDRELGGQFGVAARWYMEGPWAEGTPSQGWQLALTPAQIYRIVFSRSTAGAEARKGKRFAELAPTDQDEVLALLEAARSISTASRRPSSSSCSGRMRRRLSQRSALWRQPGHGGLAHDQLPGRQPVLTDAVDSTANLPGRSDRDRRLGRSSCRRVMPHVDVVIVGMGWTGSIAARELADTGLRVVGLERGRFRDTIPDFTAPKRWTSCAGIRAARCFRTSRGNTITFRNKPTRLRCRCAGSAPSCPAKASAGRASTGTASIGASCRPISSLRSHNEERYGKDVHRSGAHDSGLGCHLRRARTLLRQVRVSSAALPARPAT